MTALAFPLGFAPRKKLWTPKRSSFAMPAILKMAGLLAPYSGGLIPGSVTPGQTFATGGSFTTAVYTDSDVALSGAGTGPYPILTIDIGTARSTRHCIVFATSAFGQVTQVVVGSNSALTKRADDGGSPYLLSVHSGSCPNDSGNVTVNITTDGNSNNVSVIVYIFDVGASGTPTTTNHNGATGQPPAFSLNIPSSGFAVACELVNGGISGGVWTNATADVTDMTTANYHLCAAHSTTAGTPTSVSSNVTTGGSTPFGGVAASWGP